MNSSALPTQSPTTLVDIYIYLVINNLILPKLMGKQKAENEKNMHVKKIDHLTHRVQDHSPS